jgi:GntR family transcriptional regulator/MocR family aminotransferase
MRLLYSQRRSALVDSLGEQFGGTLQILGAEAGTYLLVKLPKGFRDMEIARRAALKKLWVWPLSASYLDKSSRQGLVLGFGGTPAEEIPNAVRQLKSVLLAHGGPAADNLEAQHPLVEVPAMRPNVSGTSLAET